MIRLPTAVERTQDQERRLGIVRDRREKTDARFREQGIGLEVPVTRALEELIEGAPSTDLCPSYLYAFHELVACHFSDTTDLGVWTRPLWFYRLSDELARLGVPSDVLPGSFLFSGPPPPPATPR
ncbi:hypothetical protein [Streptomyces sp. HUAS ZL42]|uniref:DUF7691 family protein n=1 Tax=Streptomyces sp. HUAS ZL42 TaxID=3231715 RepID=UPI00345E4477